MKNIGKKVKEFLKFFIATFPWGTATVVLPTFSWMSLSTWVWEHTYNNHFLPTLSWGSLSIQIRECMLNHYIIYSLFSFFSVIVFSASISTFTTRSKNFFIDVIGIIVLYMMISASIIWTYATMYHIIFNMNIIDSVYSSSKVFTTIGIPKLFGKSLLYGHGMKVLFTVTMESILSHIISVSYISLVLVGYQENRRS